MKIVPLFKVRNLNEAIHFYTKVLDFELQYDEEHAYEWGGADLERESAELQLTTYESEKLFGSVCNVWVDDVDGLFDKYIKRGLDTSHKKESPVHQGPLDQSWGTREFYVTDADSNTLRFCKRLQ
jgi:catechol 2,3-dioxygenase-like lactoylglutathione lyase family enzyme